MADDTRTTQVNLGCGTLILIALIVLIFSGRGNDDLKREVQSLSDKVTELEQTVNTQTITIERMRQTLERQQAAPGPVKDK